MTESQELQLLRYWKEDTLETLENERQYCAALEATNKEMHDSIAEVANLLSQIDKRLSEYTIVKGYTLGEVGRAKNKRRAKALIECKLQAMQKRN